MAYQRKDAYYARAKASGYRSRSAFKLQELARKYQLIRRGDHVVDLGAWPGGWLQVAGELVGPQGLVVGVDLQAIESLNAATISTLVGDAREPSVQDELSFLSRQRVNVVLSDMAPNLSGIRDRDVARAAELAETALAVAQRLLAPGGRLLVKVFSGAEHDALAAARRLFSSVKLTKPDASRKESAEMYLVGVSWRG
ncbi:MAG: RlmE family RNA methyltransferase [bacterium]